MIGQKINEFDNLPEEKCTVARFNELFRTKLGGDLSLPVEILGITIGGLREVVINGKLELVDVPIIAKEVENASNYEGRFIYKVFKDEVFMGTFKTALEIQKKFGVTRETVSSRVKLGGTTKTGFRFKQIDNPDY